MKNYSDTYNRLVNAIVIAGDMLICGAAFLGMVKLTGYKMDTEAGVLSTLNVPDSAHADAVLRCLCGAYGRGAVPA